MRSVGHQQQLDLALLNPAMMLKVIIVLVVALLYLKP
jgi:hypothetical protein